MAHAANHPEVAGVGSDVCVGKIEISLVSYSGPPRISNSELLITVRVADCHHGVAPNGLTATWQRNVSPGLTRRVVDILEYREAEHEGITLGQRAFELRQHIGKPLIRDELVFFGIGVSLRGRL